MVLHKVFDSCILDSGILYGHTPSRSPYDYITLRECKFFFNRFIHRKLSFVELWLRFDTSLECQREELKDDNKSIHTTPKLMTLWAMEKQCGMIYTLEVFQKFQSHVLAARDHCFIQDITDGDEMKIVTISSHSRKERVVTMDPLIDENRSVFMKIDKTGLV
jgi:hypothetical protein